MVHFKACIVTEIISTVLITIAAFIPGWFVIVSSASSYRVYMNLFYGISCSEPNNCVLATYTEIYKFAERPSTDVLWLIEFQVEIVLPIVLSVVSIVLQLIYKRWNLSHKLLVASILLCIFSGALILVGCGRILTATLSANQTLDAKSAGYYYNFPFSLVPAGIGGVLQIIAAILIYLYRKQELKDDGSDDIVFYRAG